MNTIKRWWYNLFGDWKKVREAYSTLKFEGIAGEQTCKGLVYILENKQTGARKAIAEEPDGTTHRISLAFAEQKFKIHDNHVKTGLEKGKRSQEQTFI